MSQSVNSSNHASTAAYLTSRGIKFHRNRATNQVKNISFEAEWKKFAEACGSRKSSRLAWTCFESVMRDSYSLEPEFSNALFSALKKSLSGIVEDTPRKQDGEFALRGRKFGFTRNCRRQRLGFGAYFGAEREGNSCDHACVAFKEGTFEYDDVTAQVELKLSKSSCHPFVLDDSGAINEPPILENKHGAFGQALIYSLDVLACLSRRGVIDQTDVDGKRLHLPVVVLAGKKDGDKKPARLCCVDGRLCFPEYSGDEFLYEISSHFPFQNNRNQRLQFEQKAIAVYIRAMRIGAEFAKAIELQHGNANNGTKLTPRSLCGRKLRVGNCDMQSATLIACPIPDANPTGDIDWKISQGEIFRLNERSFAWLNGVGVPYYLFRDERDKGSVKLLVKRFLTWLTDFVIPDWLIRNERDKSSEHFLMKVSCAAVHRHLVPPEQCWKALTTLSDEITNNLTRKEVADLRAEIANVLQACVSTGGTKQRTLFIVMKDISTTYVPLKPVEYTTQMPQLWKGLCTLVTNVLLPMAALGVVHTDIRPGWDETFNIFCSQDSGDDEIRLVLIDFESLALEEDAAEIQISGGALPLGGLLKNRTAFKYVWWLVLWIAYKWKPTNNHLSCSMFISRVEHRRVASLFSNLDDGTCAEIQAGAFKETIERCDVLTLLRFPIAGLF